MENHKLPATSGCEGRAHQMEVSKESNIGQDLAIREFLDKATVNDFKQLLNALPETDRDFKELRIAIKVIIRQTEELAQ